MEKGVCYIVGAGEDAGLDFHPGARDMVIAADAGLCRLEAAGIAADLAIGDFDSLAYVPAGPHVIALPREKDDTDMLAAVREGIKAGYRTFYLYGGTGGRMDHTLANLQLLAYLAKTGRRGLLIGPETAAAAIRNGTLAFRSGARGYISVFAYTPRAEGVSLRGLKYPLEDAALTSTYPIGTSNEFTGAESRISVRRGTLLVVFPREAMERMMLQ